MNAILALEDGTWYRGVAAGAPGEARGEVVFNTSMTGYQEVLTDPSYAGQIVTMTAPQIGNYGVAPGDAESQAPRVAGFVMREASPVASNWRADGTLRDYLVRHNIVAIADIDTRALTRVLRSAGVMRGVIATGPGRSRRSWSRRRAPSRRWKASDLVRERDVRQRRSSGASAPRASGDADHAEFGIAPQRARGAAAARGGLRLRHQVQHPAPARRLRLRRARVSGDGARQRTCWRSSPTASS